MSKPGQSETWRPLRNTWSRSFRVMTWPTCTFVQVPMVVLYRLTRASGTDPFKRSTSASTLALSTKCGHVKPPWISETVAFSPFYRTVKKGEDTTLVDGTYCCPPIQNYMMLRLLKVGLACCINGPMPFLKLLFARILLGEGSSHVGCISGVCKHVGIIH